MKKLVILLVVILSITALAAIAMAVPGGKSVTYDATFGAVTFSSDSHLAAGLKCDDCHPDIFPKRAGAAYTASHKLGESCGVCHNGNKAFSATKDCKMCHKR